MSIKLLQKYESKRVSFKLHGRQGTAVLVYNLPAGLWAFAKIHWTDQPDEDEQLITLSEDMLRSAQEIEETLVLIYPSEL